MIACDCCAGVHVVTPRSVTNRPGLPRLAYRVGTHGSFLASMVARLSSRDHATLQQLAARTPDDAIMAMLDGWATIADVLTFYQERIANEGFLRTASERRSILELGRLVDWMLRPGVSATAYLSFTVDPDPQDPGKDRIVTIPAGSRVQNVPDPPSSPPATVPALGILLGPPPAPDPRTLPQSFETAENLVARALWSRLEPRNRRPIWIGLSQASFLPAVYLSGVIRDLKPGTRLVLDFGGGAGEVATVAATDIDEKAEVTTVRLLGSKRRIQELIEKAIGGFLTLEGRPKGQTATELSDKLKGVLKGQAEPRSLAALATAVSAASSIVRESALGFRARGFSNLAAWADLLLEALAYLAKGIEAARRAPLDVPGASEMETIGSLIDAPSVVGAAGADIPARPVLDDLGGVLVALRKAASIQPADGRALAREPHELFGGGSDLGPQILTSLDGRLAPTLYRALEGIPPEVVGLRGVSAMRIRCQPFGATAPLRAIKDEGGFVTGSEDWAIDGEATFQVRMITSDSSFDNLVLSVSTGEATVEGPYFGDQIVSLEPFGEARVDATQSGVVVTFVRLDPEKGDMTDLVTIDVGLDDPAKLEFYDDAGNSLMSLAVAGGTTQRRTAGIRTYVATLGDDEVPELVITTRQPLPPFPRDILDLDAEYEGIIPDGWVVVEYGDDRQRFIGSIEAVSTVSRAAYGIVAKVTRLTLRATWLERSDVELEMIRNATVFVLGQALELALQPIDEPICGETIRLQRVYPGLQTGRWIVVEGERSDVPGSSGVRTAELAMVAGVTLERQDFGDSIHTVISLARPLAHCYQRATAVIHGNVAEATHGETREEILGGGDAAKPLQSFVLRAKPVAYLADATPLGASSTVELRVDRLRWDESRDLVTLGPRDRRFILRTDDADTTTTTFGTGSRGARPSTGQENITARYRTGTGMAGNLPAGKITQLTTRPLGVSAVVNPLPSTGGADRETLEQGRRNLPLGVLALDRLVSVRDYEDFTRARAGIGQASATALSDGARRVVHVTIAGTGDAPIDPSSDLFRALRLALHEAGDPTLPVSVAVRELILLIVAVNVQISSDRLWVDMEPVIRSRLLERFGFDARRLGQDVLVSEVQATIQAIPGVVYSDVDVLHGVPETIAPEDLATLGATIGLPPSGRIPVRLARFEESTFEVDGFDMTLTDVASRTGVSVSSLVSLNPDLAGSALWVGTHVVVGRGIRPAQIALLSPTLPDTLILRELRP